MENFASSVNESERERDFVILRDLHKFCNDNCLVVSSLSKISLQIPGVIYRARAYISISWPVFFCGMDYLSHASDFLYTQLSYIWEII